MKHPFLLIPALLLTHLAAGQSPGLELVRNGGFEEVRSAPYTYDQLKLAEGWGNVTLGLSEVFDSTAAAKTVGLPNNDYGTIKPSQGQRCAGFFAWKDDMRRNWEGGNEDPFMKGWSAYSEYLITDLIQPLQAGQYYNFSMDIALADNSDRAVSGIGAYFSPVTMHADHRRFLEDKALVATEEIVSERGVWTRISGTFEADGGEAYLVVGVFPYVGFETMRMIQGPDNQYAYYYLDAITLKAVPKPEE